MKKKIWSSLFLAFAISFVGEISHVEASLDELPGSWPTFAKQMLTQEEIDEINGVDGGKGFYGHRNILGRPGTEGTSMIPIRVNTDGFGSDNKFEQYIVFGKIPSIGRNVKKNSRSNYKLLHANDPSTANQVETSGMYGYKGYRPLPGTTYGDGYGISYPHIITFLNEDAKKDGDSTYGLTYGHDADALSGDGNSRYFDGSGVLLTRNSDRRESSWPFKSIQGITGFPRTDEPSRDGFQLSDASRFDRVLFNEEKDRAYIFGYYRIRHTEYRRGTTSYDDLQPNYKELPMILKVGSTDKYGSVEYSYRFLDESIKDNTNSYTLGYVQHMDIGGVHIHSKMRTLGDNRGVYFDAKDTDPTNEQPENLFGDDDIFYNYNVQFNSTNLQGEKDKILRTVDLGVGKQGEVRLYPQNWSNWYTGTANPHSRQEYKLVEDEDQPRGEVITRRDSEGKIMREKNAHPGFGLYFEPQRLSPENKVARFDIRGSVTNVPPVNYPGMTLKSSAIKATENKLEPQIVDIEQSLEGNLYSSTRQPGKLDLTFKLDKSIFLTELTDDNVELFLADLDGKNQELLPIEYNGKKVYDSAIYPYDSNNPMDTSKQSMVLSLYNDFRTGADNIEGNNGTTGFLWNNRENKKIIMRFKTRINEETASLGSVYEHTKPENFTGEDFKRNFQPKVEVETLWNENISEDITERVADQRPVSILFESNIYSAQAKKADTLIFGEKDIVKPEQVIENISRNFDWEKPYIYKFTDVDGNPTSINMSGSNTVKTTYVTVESPSLSNTIYKESAPEVPITKTAVSNPIKVQYYVKPEANNFRRAEINYVDGGSNEVIDIPHGYENTLSGIKPNENFSFSVPDEILLPSGQAHYKFEKVVATPSLTTDVTYSKSEQRVSGKMPDRYNQVFTIQYTKIAGGLSDTIQADAVPQKFTIGEDLKRASNPKKWIENVTKGSETLDESMFNVTIKEGSYVPDVIGKLDESNSTVSVIVTSVEGDSKELELPIPFEAEYGNSIGIGGDEAIVNGSERLGGGAYTLYPKAGKSKSYIGANSGAVISNDNAPIQSKSADKYFGLSIHRPTGDYYDILNESRIFDSGEIMGTKKKSDLLNEFGSNRQVEVESGDVVRVWNQEGEKTYLTENNQKSILGSEWERKSEQYFEVTDNGYRRLYGNLAVPAPADKRVLVPYDITDDELDSQIEAFLDISKIKEVSPSVKVVGFKDVRGKIMRPKFDGPNSKSQGLIEVSETLSSGKEVTYYYEVFFQATDEKTWMNTSINYLVKEKGAGPSASMLDRAVINNIEQPDFDNKNPKREPNKVIETRKGTKIEPLLSTYEKEFTHYDRLETYLYLPSVKEFTLIDSKTVVPAEDYMIIYYYSSKQIFDIPTSSLSFGERSSSKLAREYSLVGNKDEKENKILVIDTNEVGGTKSGWELQASTTGLYNDVGVRLVADLVFKNSDNQKPVVLSNESTPIYQSSELYKKDIMLVDGKETEGLFIRVGGYGQLGEYTGKIKYTLGVYP